MAEYDVGYLLGILFGVAVAGVALVIFMVFSKKDRSIQCKYDERQERVRGKGYQYAFAVLFVYSLVYAMLGDYMEKIAERSVLLFFGVILSTLIYVSYTVWNDGYFSLNEKPKSWVFFFLILAAVNVLHGVWDMSYYGVRESGVVSDSIIGLMVGICVLLILAVMLFKRFCKKGEGQDEE